MDSSFRCNGFKSEPRVFHLLLCISAVRLVVYWNVKSERIKYESNKHKLVKKGTFHYFLDAVCENPKVSVCWILQFDFYGKGAIW